MDTPARCTACQNCKAYKFRTDSISFKKNREYKVIIYGLQLDIEKKKWTALYPFCISPWTLIHSYCQARKCREMQERWLIKSGRLKEFNSQFYDTMQRGVFRNLSLKDWLSIPTQSTTSPWWRPLKMAPHIPTPLQKCMNSKLKQPPPSGKSPNNCLMKGSSALVDLFTVTLGVQEFQYTLTKDLSKFFQ
jgi:hypothetical protein